MTFSRMSKIMACIGGLVVNGFKLNSSLKHTTTTCTNWAEVYCQDHQRDRDHLSLDDYIARHWRNKDRSRDVHQSPVKIKQDAEERCSSWMKG